jgi:hypothetical protein
MTAAGPVPSFATGSRRPDAHVWRDLAVSRALMHSAIAWNELWDAFRSDSEQSLFRLSLGLGLGHERTFK